MEKNYYDVLAKQENGLNKVILTNVTYEKAQKKVFDLNEKGFQAEIWSGFFKY